MSTAYFDTSAFVKLLVAEAGTPETQQAWNAVDDVASSRLLYVEARAALAAAERGGRLPDHGAERAKADLEVLWAQMHPVEVSAALVTDAAGLAEAHSLRGYDAVHLASALLVEADVLVTSDVALAHEGRVTGLAVAEPGPASTTWS